jgi:hypothetical protein
MNPTSIRLPHDLEQFAKERDEPLGKTVREHLRAEWYQQLAGVCASCSQLVFIGDGHTNVQASTPLGQLWPEVEIESFDLCGVCAESAYEDVAEGSGPSLDLNFMKFICGSDGDQGYFYTILRAMIIDVDADSLWKEILGQATGTDSESNSFIRRSGRASSDQQRSQGEKTDLTLFPTAQEVRWILDWAEWHSSRPGTSADGVLGTINESPDAIILHVDADILSHVATVDQRVLETDGGYQYR